MPRPAIAIIGMACRFPKANGLEAFWRLLAEGRSGVTEGVPGSGEGRVGQLFPDADVRHACRFGAYLGDLDRFDAGFFRISPAEAELLDPQQRLMLETSWRALEDAGIPASRLRGSRTGVYAGISNNEYRTLILDASDTSEAGPSLHSVTGTSFNTAIGRVSYALGLEGPAIALDTACSSSLVAIHQAVSGLQRSEADLALAGGVHTILSGRLLELRANAGMLSPDGRCATFDAAANGYVRGEGCGIVVLKRLEDARDDGDRIWAILRGAAINQDGASPGLTVPSGPAQERVIAAALEDAGLEPTDVDYVEAHGTGTRVGDPIEARATGAAYGRGRAPGRSLLIGSVKTNFGHLESAAGVAGVIKVVLSMRQGLIPRHLHFREPSPEIAWERLPLEVTAQATPWPDRAPTPPRAGVSGFGWSGTNAHLILEGVGGLARPSRRYRPPAGSALAIPVARLRPGAAGVSCAPRATRLLPLSGRTEAAVRRQAQRHAERVDEQSPVEGLADLAWTAATGRTHFGCRKAVIFADPTALKRDLEAVAAEGGDVARAPGPPERVAFLYTGQASQWVGMGRVLYQTEPVVRSVLDRCEEAFHAGAGASLLDAMFGRGDAGESLDDPAWTQPAIYALECALTDLWASLGVRPDLVLGHSLGEIAAARAAGAFGLEDGLRFAAARGALMADLPGEGAMGAVFASAERVAEAVTRQNADSGGPGVSIAADNGAHQSVSGPAVGVEALLRRFERDGVRVARLRGGAAYHSALVEPALDGVAAAAARIPSSPVTGFVSSLTGRRLPPGAVLDADYWRRQAREAVAFRSGVEELAGGGVEAVVELGPHSVLAPMFTLAWPDAGKNGGPPPTIPSLLRPGSRVSAAEADRAFASAVAAVWEAGCEVSLEGLFAGERRRRVAAPGVAFDRERYWVPAGRARRRRDEHPVLGARHESASGETCWDTRISAADPEWLADHRVFGEILTPGALYGALAAEAARAEGQEAGSVAEEVQLVQPLLLAEADSASDGERALQVLLDAPDEQTSRRLRILSRGAGEDEWTLHAEARLPERSRLPPRHGDRDDLAALRGALRADDPQAFYRARTAAGIGFGPSFRTLRRLWSGPGEALGEVALAGETPAGGRALDPRLLDGCFQVLGAARRAADPADGTLYLPFGWDRMWLVDRLPDRIVCHAVVTSVAESANGSAEVVTGDLRLFDEAGRPVGEVSGYRVKRATRAALLAAAEPVEDLLYEIQWRDHPLAPGIESAAFLDPPASVAGAIRWFPRYLEEAGVDRESRTALLDDLERLSLGFALETLDRLGWERVAGGVVAPEELRRELGVGSEHRPMFRRILEMAARSGVLREAGDRFEVVVGSGEPRPEVVRFDPGEYATRMAARYAHGTTEIGLFRRSANALPEVLRGAQDPLTLLFSSGSPSAADLYRKAPVARAANRLLADAISRMLGGLPATRRLRIVEIGAGTGSATAAVLPVLPEGRFDYAYTDISAGFFAEAESRFGSADGAIEYRVLDIERDPVEQGFGAHGYDLVIASNVLHATRSLPETLGHCLSLLAPSGHLVALENLRGQSWLDLTFGQLDGWWRFADHYRPHHALAEPAVWGRALADAGFAEVAVLGVDESDPEANPDRGVVVARGPEEIAREPGVWILTGDRGGTAEALAAELVAKNQAVVVAEEHGVDGVSPPPAGPRVLRRRVEARDRSSWESLLGDLPDHGPLAGVVHLAALDGATTDAGTVELADDLTRIGAGALALVQALIAVDATPARGFWFVTRGGQVVERERGGQLAGSALWGLGKVMARETPWLGARMIDLDPEARSPLAGLVDELLFPDAETHVVHRFGRRRAARLVRSRDAGDRLRIPDGGPWLLEADAGGSLGGMEASRWPSRPLGADEVRIAVEATGLNFWDLFRALGVIEEGLLGGEFCGRVTEVGADVSGVSAGARVIGLSFGAFGSEAVTSAAMVTPAPAGLSVTQLATLPTAYVSAVLSFDLSGLEPGDRVLIHAGAGGVGLAAIRWAQAAGAEVFATASARKRAFLRSLGVRRVFDSRTTAFGERILEATGGRGVDVVLNSLTSEGFIEASLACLAPGGRFVELARVDIWTEEQMAAARPDVAYSILMLDRLKEHDPETPGDALRRVAERVGRGEIPPILHSRWPLAEAAPAMRFMQAARHIGKIVLTAPPLAGGRLRADRAYLVTGGLGGIGCALAGWLVDRGAGTIVLNGRRAPDPEAEAAIAALRSRGARVRVELADVTDRDQVAAMFERLDRDVAPIAGVIHSVGVLADAALSNQTWERFGTVLWPKALGAWRLHRATLDSDLDLFVLFSSVAGVLGNPGQANHAAANAFLDQIAAHRRALGLPGQAIAWGAWSGLGEAEEQRDRIAGQLEATGTRWMTPRQGLEAFGRLLAEDAAGTMVAAVDWPAFAEAVDDPPTLIEDLLEPATTESAPSDDAVDLPSRLAATPPGERRELLTSFLRREVQVVLRLSSPAAPSVGFFDLGMDSLMAVEFRNRLNRALAGAYTAPPTLVFDTPNIAAMAEHLASELGERDEPAPHEEAAGTGIARAPSRASGRRDAIAVVGMACRFPGAPDPESYWRLLESGGNAISEGRPGGGSWTGVCGDPRARDPMIRWGGFLDDVDRFDARFFGIPPIEARTMDPSQRLLLETSWRALEDAGIPPSGLRGSSTGVYAGVGSGEYRDLLIAAGEDHGFLGSTGSVTASRVAFTLGLRGPAVAVDMTCASSLAALHFAVAALERGDVDLALAGGVSVVLSPQVTRFMQEFGMLSRTGTCRPFEAEADGFVRGEGCGIVVLKRLADAEAAGDRILGMILGSAVNQNGAAVGLTAPNGSAQQQVLGAALRSAGVSPASVDYLEAHAVGSRLGDPIELNAAASVYGAGREADRPLFVGSVKARIGHLEAAAGIAGVIKVLLAMHRGVVPGHGPVTKPNPEIAWDRSAARIAAAPREWPVAADRPPRAAVSAFGLSGANAHVVLEGCGSARGAPVPAPSGGTSADEAGRGRARILPLSARSAAALRELAAAYRDWLDKREAEADGADLDALLADMAWSASTGRSGLSRRAAVVFRDAASLREQLAAVARGAAPASGGLPEAAAWEAGSEVSLAGRFAGESRRRISLPGYPFQRRRYWVGSGAGRGAGSET